MPKKKKQVTELKQADGKDYEAESAQLRKTLDQVWGYKFSKYTTDDPEVYRESLSKMNKIDLQRECIRIGLMPHDKRDIMSERLMKQFVTFRACNTPAQSVTVKAGNTKGKAEAILSRTRGLW